MIYVNPPVAARLGEPVASLAVAEGEIVSASGARASYWELAASDLLDRDATGQAAPKPASAHRIVGEGIARLDLPDKIFGMPCFIHDLELPQMLHGRVLRPPSPDAALIDLDETEVRALPDVVTVVRDGSLVGMLAESEAGADGALQRIGISMVERRGQSHERCLSEVPSLIAWVWCRCLLRREYFNHANRSVEDSVVRVNRQFLVSGSNGLIRALCAGL